MPIRIVPMRMNERRMAMHVGMRFGPVPGTVGVLVVFIMEMRVAVLLRRVRMQVFMALRQMQPDAGCHQ